MVLGVIVQVARAPRTVPASGDGWRGLFYVNPSDPRLIVPRRSGLGWTFNFARPVAWWCSRCCCSARCCLWPQ